ncbi:MAG: restriction endonuclease [Acidobacteriaceae bacterium]|nr:restriction endonuclease [Acidobacteriaceae bacterium]
MRIADEHTVKSVRTPKTTQSFRCSFCGLSLPQPMCALASCPVLDNSIGLHVQGQEGSTPELDNMSGQEFEIFVRDQLLRKGFKNIETTPGTGDMGADLIVHHQSRKIVIQCKRSSNPVGVAAVQEVLGARCFYTAQEAWVVTNATFTDAARRLARTAEVRLKVLKLGACTL